MDLGHKNSPPPKSPQPSGTPSSTADASVGGRGVEVLRLEKVSKSFAGNDVVRNVSLSVNSHQVVSIIGPSGAGKSTLLRCVNFLETPTSGSIYLHGKEVCRGRDRHGRPLASELTKHRRAMGMVFQHFNLFPHLTALGNVTLAQERVLGRPRSEANDRARALLDRVGLLDRIDALPRTLSGGERQRVAIARALALDPTVMLFDEPTSSLDPEFGADVLAVMRDLADGGMTMLVVTHEMQFAREVSDHTVVMADGVVIEAGPPEQVFSAPSVERTQKFLRAVVGR